MENIFESIINKKIEADIVYETDRVLAFLDINPFNKGHTLVIPKKPTKDILELDELDAKELLIAIKKLSASILKTTKAKGLNITSNNGAEAGQEVFHLHFHIIPRFNLKEIPKLERTIYENKEDANFYKEEIIKNLSV